MSTFVLPMASVAPPMFGKKLHPPNLNSEVILLLLPSSLLPPMAGNTRVLPEASNLPPMVGKTLTPSSNPKLDEVFGDCHGPAVRRPRFWAFPPLPSIPSTCFRLPPIMSVAFMPMPPTAGNNDATLPPPPVAGTGLSNGNQDIASTLSPSQIDVRMFLTKTEHCIEMHKHTTDTHK